MRIFFLLLFISGVCISTDLQAQKSGLDSLTSSFNHWRNTTLQEKIFIHTDRSSYLTGETVWLKAFRFDATTHRAIDWSKVLYIELLDKNMLSVLQAKLMLDETGGDGSVFLPTSLASGNYILRAYTNWMKNSGPEFFFNQPITVLNPFVPLEEVSEVTQIKYDVQFFPEGGHLVYDLPAVVGVRAVNQNGYGIKFTGVVVNERNDTVSRFASGHAGLSKFAFVPQTGHSYKAIIEDEHRAKFRYSLPLPEVGGYVMHVQDSTADKIAITIRTKEINANEIYLLAHTRQVLKFQQRAILRNGKGSFVIDKSLLDAGVSSFTVFNEQLKPVCERVYFQKPEKKLEINLNGNPFGIKPREKVELDVLLNESSASNTAISVSVFRKDSLELPVQTIQEYVWLTSDLSGTVENPGYYFSNQTPELQSNTDNLMLTHGWRRFDWNGIISKQTQYRYTPELNGHLIRAKIKETSTGKPADKVPVYLSFMGKDVSAYVSLSETGQVLFETQPFTGNKSMIVQTDSQVGNQYRIELEESFSDKGSYFCLPFSLDLNQASVLEQRSIHMQVQNLFYESKPSMKPEVYKTFYGKPDDTYQLDDYTRFPTLEEVMREYVPGIRVKKRGTEFQLSNIDLINRVAFAQPPLVLVDGVPVFNMNKLMEIDPLNLKQLDVVKKRYYLGDLAFDGIVSYTSYKGDLAGFRPPEESLLANYKGVETKREFFTPRYDIKNNGEETLPDARRVLYWSTKSLSKSDKHWPLEFFTSDIAGEYKIVIQALTSDGLPGYYSATFIVK